MTAEKLHDAITLLPADLIAQADQKRSASHPPLRWQRFAAMAACFGLLCFSGLWCVSHLRLGAKKSYYDMAMAPMAAQAPEVGTSDAAEADELVRSQSTMETSPAASGKSATGAMDTTSLPALTVSRDGIAYPLNPEAQETIWNLLNSLAYDPEAICNCIAPITIEVDSESQYEVNLEEGFVRCAQGQASLTQEQLNTLTQILTDLSGE